jgi:hypothetical protein
VAALPIFSFVNTPSTGGITTPVVVLPTTQATASLGDECNNFVFEGDITIPDGQTVKGGETLQKIWKIRNTGNCRWDEGYSLVYVAGTLGNDAVSNFEFKKPGDFVASGAAINIGVWFNAPCAQGSQQGHWRMRSDSGYYFGTYLSLYIEVQGKTGGCS